MTLDDWLEAEGRGAIQRLHIATGVSLPAIARARAGRANLANATKLHEAVCGRVPISTMTADEVPLALESPRRARGVRAMRARARAKRVA